MRPIPATVLSLAFALPSIALAQQEVTVNIDRGVLAERPYTVAYPQSFQKVEDGNEESVLTLQHAEAPIQCDVLVADGAAEGWSADSALSGFDRAAVESTWRSDFADFTITAQQLTGFQSGPALYYEGEARQSPMGFPVKVMHAEAADGGRTYIFECIMDLALAEETRPVVQFMIANFSTRSDAECCVTPRP